MAKKKKNKVTLPKRFTPQFWDDCDGRNSVIKEIRHRCETLKNDSHANSFQKDLLCQRAVFISIHLETMERLAVETGKFDAGVYVQATNCLIGLLKSLGLERQAKKVSLENYIKEKT